MRRKVGPCLAPVLLSLLISGCGSAASDKPMEGAPQASLETIREEETVLADAGSPKKMSYQAPAFADSAFHADHATEEKNVKIDLEHTAQGYIGVSVQSDKRIKMQVLTGDGETKYTYDVPSDGTPVIFPLGEGDGSYGIHIMEQVEGTKYRLLRKVECEVKLEDEFQPFLRPSAYADYTADSECVRLAAKLAAEEENVLGVVGAVYEYICDNVAYDKDRAAKIQDKTITSYLPVVDDALRTGKGICFDYAALSAAMLRSQGIPTKIVFGYVSPNDLYHAWNMFYTKETGWVTVKYEVKGDSWNRLDLTFSANGADSTFVGDGSNYLDEYYY